MDFQLKTDFSLSGDQTTAVNQIVERSNKGITHQTVLGATGTGKTFTMANIIQKLQKPTLIIAHNKTLAAQLCTEFQEFFPNSAVSYFVSYYDYYKPEAYVAKTDTFIEKESTINEEINHFRHAATFNLLTRKDVLIVASVSCIYGLGDVSSYESLAISIKLGQEIKRDVFLRKLTDIQYTRVHLDFQQGMFNVLGDVVEVFPPSSENAFRIEFFGDEIDKISEVDSMTGEVLQELNEVIIFPSKHNVTTEEKIKNACDNIEKDLEIRIQEFKSEGRELEAERIKTRTEYDIEMLKEVGYISGIENYTRYLSGQEAGSPPATLIDYFPDDFLCMIDESHITVPQVGAMYEGNLSRKKSLVHHGFRLPSCFDNRPLRFHEFEERVNNAIYVSATPGKYEFNKCAGMEKESFYMQVEKNYKNGEKIIMPENFSEQVIRPTGLLDPKVELRDKTKQAIDSLEEIKNRINLNERVIITTLTKKSAEDFTDFLISKNINVKYLHSDIDTLERVEILTELRSGKIDVVVGINLLREGLDLPEVSLVAIFDADCEGFLRSRDALIQTIGRAARNANGKVILYTTKKKDGKFHITKSMSQAMIETSRRRETQEKYNKDNNITPKTIKKSIKNIAPTSKIRKSNLKNTSKDKIKSWIKELEKKLEIASMNLEFELAADLRDEIAVLKEQL